MRKISKSKVKSQKSKFFYCRLPNASSHNGGNPTGQFAQRGKPPHATVLRKRLAPPDSLLYVTAYDR
ncbi:hypothetical protein QH73_0021415 [Scytonema millei VB511283]|uniref:Uncharacterized protein n=1 Tax=Scytonema millei VB511283 TaxID=1245923 RepID=A0A9X5E8G0_9CYAN|nr:hypothetical protein [Scytonema millei VB511283]